MTRNVILTAAAVMLCGCHGLLETQTKHVIHSGEQAVLVESGRAVALVAVAKDDAHSLAKAIGSSDQATVDQMVKDGKILEVKNGTPVAVISETFNERQVRILAGPNEGKTGWVPFEWLKPDTGRSQ